MDPIERLSGLFVRFPGIGPRQAERFVQYVLRSGAIRRELIEALRALGDTVHQCPLCMRFSTSEKGLCSICRDQNRDTALLAIVASDADLSALERSRMFRGHYFVLGGLISLTSDATNGLNLTTLRSALQERAKIGLKEIILALPANPEGDTTGRRVSEDIADLAKERGMVITSLGRGLSTGSELEYADPDTLKSALVNRR